MRDQILHLVNENENLPPLPDILFKLNDLIGHEDIDFRDVSTLIEIEPVIAGRLMKWANSALHSSGRQEVKTLDLAIGRLGLNQVRDLIFSFLIPKLFVNARIMNHRWFWKHSLATAVFSKNLAKMKYLSNDEVESAYLGGLIHDIGIMVFATLLPKEYGGFLATVKVRKEPLNTLEQEEFGISHPELGALFAEKWWQVDKNVVDAVMSHHQSFDDIDKNLIVRIVNLANVICIRKKLHNGINTHAQIRHENRLERMGFSTYDFEKVYHTVREAISEADQLMSI